MIIYKTTNLVNNKIYVGQDTRENSSYLGSGKIIKHAINKYGIDFFRKEILEKCHTIEELNEREQYWINLLDSNNPCIGYNISTGGRGKLGCFHSEKTKRLFSKQRKGKNNPNYGKKISKEQRKILSECGKKRTGKNNTFYGRHHSKETKIKISNANSIHLSVDKENEILKLYKEYGTLEISKRIKIGKKKVCNVLKKHNTRMRKAGAMIGNTNRKFREKKKKWNRGKK